MIISPTVAAEQPPQPIVEETKMADVKLFELSAAEKAALESQEKRRSEASAQLASGEPTPADIARREMFRKLATKYPPSTGNGGLKIWRFKGAHTHDPQPTDLDFAAYVEVALNGGHFDPRNDPARHDLDIPQFNDAEKKVELAPGFAPVK